MKYKVGDFVKVLDKGYIKLVDVMGSDEEICTAARVSYHEKSTKKVNEDKGLIDHLLRHRHTSPFEMGEMKFEIKLPIVVERQWVRHRTCSMNEMSGRYSEMPEEYYEPAEYREQAKDNKQGSDGDLVITPEFLVRKGQTMNQTWEEYHEMIEMGVSREMARNDLPLSTYTKKVWKMDLHNLFHFLKLRTDSHAQWEIRQYADHMERFVEANFPWSYASWKNHIKDAVILSADEIGIFTDALTDKWMIGRIDKLEISKTRKLELKAKLGLT